MHIFRKATKNMESNWIVRTESFLKRTFAESTYLSAHPEERDYRLEHSYRVANIAKTIAEAEGFPAAYAVIGGLLHDIAYCEEMKGAADWRNHGRRSAAIARPFLESLGLPPEGIRDICYGIAIHVDDKADFPGERTPFCETIGDADNIDRFDAYRIYETLQYMEFSKMSLARKKEVVTATLEKMERLKQLKLATPTANRLWQQRLSDYAAFYEKLRAQLDNSSAIQK